MSIMYSLKLGLRFVGIAFAVCFLTVSIIEMLLLDAIIVCGIKHNIGIVVASVVGVQLHKT